MNYNNLAEIVGIEIPRIINTMKRQGFNISKDMATRILLTKKL